MQTLSIRGNSILRVYGDETVEDGLIVTQVVIKHGFIPTKCNDIIYGGRYNSDGGLLDPSVLLKKMFTRNQRRKK